MSFKLKIDPVKVDREFKMIDKSIIKEEFNPMVTRLEDLGIDEKNVLIEPSICIPSHQIFLFAHSHEMVKKKEYPLTTHIPCFHCTETFTTKPLGIPIRYIHSYIKESFVSEKDSSNITFTRDLYTEKEKQTVRDRGQTIINRDFYYADGNFCSFPCMISYLEFRSRNSYYKESYMLLKKMYFSLYKTHIQWTPAPDIRLLKKFGGHLSINEFRSEEGRKYKLSVNVEYPKFLDTDQPSLVVPCSLLYQYHGTKMNT